MSSQQEASGFAHSSRPASETGFERNFIHPSYKELLAQVPKEGREFITSLSFYNSMSEAASGARAEGSITVDINNVKAVREFSRFLALKLYTTDTMADKISPTPLMDAIVSNGATVLSLPFSWITPEPQNYAVPNPETFLDWLPNTGSPIF